MENSQFLKENESLFTVDNIVHQNKGSLNQNFNNLLFCCFFFFQLVSPRVPCYPYFYCTLHGRSTIPAWYSLGIQATIQHSWFDSLMHDDVSADQAITLCMLLYATKDGALYAIVGFASSVLSKRMQLQKHKKLICLTF